MVVLVFNVALRYAFNSGATVRRSLALAVCVADVHGRCGGPARSMATWALTRWCPACPAWAKNLSGAGPGGHAVCVLVAAQRQLGEAEINWDTEAPVTRVRWTSTPVA